MAGLLDLEALRAAPLWREPFEFTVVSGFLRPATQAALLADFPKIDSPGSFVVVEVVPVWGTLVAFRRSERSFHGYRPFVGERRVVQLNWVTDRRVMERELRRHRRSARLKAWMRWIRWG